MAGNTFQKSSITLEAAERIIKAAEAKSQEMGKAMCIAVCDEDGVLKAFRRMDGAALLSVQIAQDKAYTAISFGGLATHEWYDFIKNDPPLLNGIVKTDRLVIFGGGFPIKVGDEIIGTIENAGHRAGEVIDVIRLPALGGGDAAESPSIHDFTRDAVCISKFWQLVKVMQVEDVSAVEV